MFNFERLDVWHKSVGFASLVYRVTRIFPEDERYGLTAQMRRAAVSVGSNTAEGSARPKADFARFLGYAAGSVAEVVTQATVAKNERYLSEQDYRSCYESAEEISRMLSGLRGSLGDE